MLPAVHFTAALLLIYLFFLSLGDVISAGNEVNINCLPLREDAEQILIRKYFIFFFFSPLDKDICATSPHRKAHPFLRKAHKPLADGFFFFLPRNVYHICCIPCWNDECCIGVVIDISLCCGDIFVCAARRQLDGNTKLD